MAVSRHLESKAVMRRVIEQQQGRCAYCNSSLVDNPLEWDHFVPFAYLGYSPSDNWVAACQRCNRHKKARHLRTDEDLFNFCHEMVTKHGTWEEGWPEGATDTWPWVKP